MVALTQHLFAPSTLMPVLQHCPSDARVVYLLHYVVSGRIIAKKAVSVERSVHSRYTNRIIRPVNIPTLLGKRIIRITYVN